MIHLCTGVTEGYPWMDGYAESVAKHAKSVYQDAISRRLPAGHEDKLKLELQTTFFAGGFERRGWRTVPIPNNRCKSLQDGAFLDALNAGSPRDMVIFTDADMVMQRPFTYDELYDFHFTGKDEVWLGVNGEEGDSLESEASLLIANAGRDLQSLNDVLLDEWFPGWRKLPVRNCGVIVARVETYRRLYDMARGLLPVVESVFEHYAAIQWCLCYCVGRWLKHRLLPRTIHVHGHFGLPEGCVWDVDGNVRVETEHRTGASDATREGACAPRGEGELAVFRHCLNLTPEKGPKPDLTAENAKNAETQSQKGEVSV